MIALLLTHTGFERVETDRKQRLWPSKEWEGRQLHWHPGRQVHLSSCRNHHEWKTWVSRDRFVGYGYCHGNCRSTGHKYNFRWKMCIIFTGIHMSRCTRFLLYSQMPRRFTIHVYVFIFCSHYKSIGTKGMCKGASK